MGFYQAIPAKNLAATYEPQTKTLYLFAEGDAQKYTSGIALHRDGRFVGGLKFDLMGWVGPIGQGTQPYSLRQPVQIADPPRVVIIEDASGSHEVPVRWLDADVVLSSAAPGAAAPSTDHRRAILDMPFEINWPATTPQGGSVAIQFDASYLTLETAGSSNPGGKGPVIDWTFHPNKGGNTQVVITVSGGIATFIMRHVIDVEIVVLPASASVAPSARANGNGKAAGVSA